MTKIQEQLNIENKIKQGAENMLQLYQGNPQQDPEAVREVQIQLDSANTKIARLLKQYEAYRNMGSYVRSKSISRKMPNNEQSGQGELSSTSSRKSTSVHAIPYSWRYRLSHFRAETGISETPTSPLSRQPQSTSEFLKSMYTLIITFEYHHNSYHQVYL